MQKRCGYLQKTVCSRANELTRNPGFYGPHGYTKASFSSACSRFKSRPWCVLPLELCSVPLHLRKETKKKPPNRARNQSQSSIVSRSRLGSGGPKILVSLVEVLGAPAPSSLARFNSFFNWCVGVSLSLPEMLSLSCPGVSSMSKTAFDLGQLVAPCRSRCPGARAATRRRRTPCVCFVASLATTQPGLLLSSLVFCCLSLIALPCKIRVL